MPAQPTAPLVESFEAFYAREYRPVVALAYALTGDSAEAEDLAQEAFIAAYRSWDSIDHPARWVRSAISNKAMSWWRRSYSAKRATKLMYQPDQGIVELPADSNDFWRQVRELPRRQAQVIALYYLDDQSTEEVAVTLGCATSTVRIHLTRGRRALAAQLGVTE